MELSMVEAVLIFNGIGFACGDLIDLWGSELIIIVATSQLTIAS
jgi:hypothetical protein